MPADWYCQIAGKRIGPLSARQMRALARQGKLMREHRVRRGTRGRWVLAGSVKGLFPGEESPPRALPRGACPVAEPLDEARQTGDPEPAVARPVKPLDVPIAKSRPEPPSPAAPPRRSTHAAPPARPAAAPEQVARAPVGPFAVDTLGNATSATTGRQRTARRRTTNTVAVVALAVLVAGLGIAGTALVYRGGNPPPQPSDTTAATQQGPDTPQADEAPEPSPASTTGGATRTSAAESWQDASKAGASCGDAKVEIASARVGLPRLIRASGRAAKPKSALLLITVELENTDRARTLEYVSWNGPAALASGTSLQDNLGNPCYPKTFSGAKLPGQFRRASIRPGESIEDVLLFENPLGTAGLKFLRLQLPASALGEPGTLRFEIPVAMIEPMPPPSAPTGPTPGHEGPGRPITTGVPEIERGIEELETQGRKLPGDRRGQRDMPGTDAPPSPQPLPEGQRPADGDVSKISRDIEQLGGGDETPPDVEFSFEEELRDDLGPGSQGDGPQSRRRNPRRRDPSAR